MRGGKAGVLLWEREALKFCIFMVYPHPPKLQHTFKIVTMKQFFIFQPTFFRDWSFQAIFHDEGFVPSFSFNLPIKAPSYKSVKIKSLLLTYITYIARKFAGNYM